MHHGAARQGHRAPPKCCAPLEGAGGGARQQCTDCLETAWRLGDLLAEPRTEVSDADERRVLAAAHQEELLGGSHPRRSRTLVSLAGALLAMQGDGAAAARDEATPA